jgi:two-component system, cell cycle sensor histidine kinase and response regulator CckA
MLHNHHFARLRDRYIQMADTSPTTDLFQALVEHSSDAIVLLDAAGKVLFLSQTSERLLGHPIAERLGKSAFEHVHADDVAVLEAVLAEVLRYPRVPKTAVARTRHRDGTWRYIEAVAVNRLGDPAVGAIVANFRDITERRRAEDALRESELRLRNIVENAQDLIYYCDPAGRFTYVNPAAERVMKFSQHELLGLHFLSLIRDDYREQAKTVYTAQMTELTPHTYFEFPALTKDGDTVWIGQHVQLVFNGPHVAAVHAIARDITRQKHAEEGLRASEAKYRFFIERAAFGIYRSTDDGRILEANPALARMLGYNSAEDLMRVNMAGLYQSPDDRVRLLEQHHGQPGGTVEMKWKKKNGDPILVRLTARTIVGRDGRESYETIAEDVTEKRALEEQLRQAQKMEAVGRLARGVAHDFNNVLAAIVGSAELLEQQHEAGDPSHIEAVEIRKAAERGASFTKQLMAFSRRQTLEPQPVNLHAAARGFESTLQRIIGSDVSTTVRTEGPATVVRMEPGQLEQILMNLAVNARDAMPAGGTLDITIDTVEVDERNAASYPGMPNYRYARVAVKDSGVGIAADMQRKVFEPFFTTKESNKGTGLGLSIVYSIARDAGGTVTVQSEPGKGTTFEVLLPIIPSP